MNVYGYCLNNPINLWDPWGLCSGHDQERLDQFANPADVSSLLASGIDAFNKGGMKGITEYFDSGPRYAYSKNIGWIDLQHVASSAALTQKIGPVGAQLIGLGVEANQAFYGYVNPFNALSQAGPGFRESAFSDEDLYSNMIGNYLGDKGKLPDPMNLLNKENAQKKCD